MPLVLLLLRLTIFLAMIMWVIDKFVQPKHASKIFEIFYGVGGVNNTIIYILGVIQLLIVIGFVLGLKKKITYGAVLIMHAASTLISLPRYLDPFTTPNLLFFSSWPMLTACFAVFYLSDLDTLWTVKQR
ncbi:MAG: hypothetical protein F6K19_46005 [Cyanothece sp. SIO1E1]|nr:hypothetical protein [Cyanothece sp. SIO1E1]